MEGRGSTWSSLDTLAEEVTLNSTVLPVNIR